MNPQVRQQLMELVRGGDTIVLRDASRVRAILADAAPDSTKEIAALAAAGVSGLLTSENMTIVTNPGTPEMQVIVKEGDQITKLDMQSGAEVAGVGTLIGSFYRLADGTVVYVPAGTTAPTGSTPVPGTTPAPVVTPTPGITPTPGATPTPEVTGGIGGRNPAWLRSCAIIASSTTSAAPGNLP